MNAKASSLLFLDNLKRLARFSSPLAESIALLAEGPYSFCQTAKQELNLIRISEEGSSWYYHSQEGAEIEAQAWLEKTFPINIKVIVIYGIGLGYYYKVLEQWLKNHSGRFLIFLEDDLHVIKKFLETELAGRFLKNTQVLLHHFEDTGSTEDLRQQLDWIAKSFCIYPISYQALLLYEQQKSTQFIKLKQQLTLNYLNAEWAYNEHILNQETVSHNFYANLPYLNSAGQGEVLQKCLAKLPVLICGAGPSLNHQFDLLKKLRNKALLLASGTAINVLTRQGIMPHLSLLVDPYEVQESRFMTNFAYEVPFIYTNRFNHRAFQLIHSFRLFLSSNSGQLREWFEDELGIRKNCLSNEGVSTTNLCCLLADFLGCNPLILVGVDLSYTNAEKYALGFTPLQEEGSTLANLIPITGLHNTPTNTKWEWVFEASFFSRFATQHPALTLLNATDQGLDIINIPHQNLAQVAQEKLQADYDIQNWLHCEIQESFKEVIPLQKISTSMKKWEESLEKCHSLCQKINEALTQFILELTHASSPIAIKETEPTADLIKELEKETAYSSFFNFFNILYNQLAAPDINKLTYFPDEFTDTQKAEITLKMERGRYQLLQKMMSTHLKSLSLGLDVLKNLSLSPLTLVDSAITTSSLLIPSAANELYALKEGQLIIQDPELTIAIAQNYSPSLIAETVIQETKAKKLTHFIYAASSPYEGQALLFYPTGQLKAECFYLSNELHGPSTFYSEKGGVVAKSWFFKGKRVGKSFQYDANGNLYSLQKYNNQGELSGTQLYFYANGCLKTKMEYVAGDLQGELTLYYAHGQKKRQQQFVKGKLQGYEYNWNEQGLLVSQLEFSMNLPSGKTRMWHSNGKLAKEIIFYENPVEQDIYFWNNEGQLIYEKLAKPEDPLERLSKKSSELQQAIDKITSHYQANQNPDDKNS